MAALITDSWRTAGRKSESGRWHNEPFYTHASAIWAGPDIERRLIPVPMLATVTRFHNSAAHGKSMKTVGKYDLTESFARVHDRDIAIELRYPIRAPIRC